MKINKYIIFGVILLVAVISGVMKDSFKSSGNNKPTSQITQSTNTNNQSQQRETNTPTTTQPQTNKPSNSNSGTVNLSTYISRKDHYDREISRLANDINTYLQSHSNFRNQHDMLSRGENLSINIRRTKTELQNASASNAAIKGKLLDVFEAEIGRVDGLVEGINASMKGGDYTPGFKHGGDAYDRFEEANEALNKMLR